MRDVNAFRRYQAPSHDSIQSNCNYNLVQNGNEIARIHSEIRYQLKRFKKLCQYYKIAIHDKFSVLGNNCCTETEIGYKFLPEVHNLFRFR